MGLGHRTSTAAVLFVDDDGWAAFDQAASALRRRGVRAIRVTHAPPPPLRRVLKEPYLRWFADRLFYDEVVVLDSLTGRRRLAELAAGGEIADAIIAEPTLIKIGLHSDDGALLIAHSLAFRGTAPDRLLNKYEVNEALEAVGVPVPMQISAEACAPTEAVARLGLPIILKNPIGAAGYGVRLVQTMEDLVPAVASLMRSGQRPFYQQYIDGSVIMYAAVIGADGKPLIEHGFRVEQSQSRLGPSAAVSLCDRSDLIELGRRATDLFNQRGFVAFGFIETPGGHLFHIDANIRVWGNVASPLKLGINYLGAYASMVREESWASLEARDWKSQPLRVYPYALFEAARSGSLREIAAHVADFLKVCHSPLGSRYCLQALGQAALLSRRRGSGYRLSRPGTRN